MGANSDIDTTTCTECSCDIPEWARFDTPQKCPNCVDRSNSQCDGCARGLPVVDGIHKGPGYDFIGCTANRY